MFFSKRLNERNLVGIWKHPILAGCFAINDGKTQKIYNNEIFVFRSDGSFTFGEYTPNGPLYEDAGRWKVNEGSRYVEFSFPNGESSRMDVKNFDGKSFYTTSREGNDFKFTKQ